MDELVILHLEGNAGPEELEELRRWREASPEHEQRYREIRAVWSLTGQRDEIDLGRKAPTARELLRPTSPDNPDAGGRRRGSWFPRSVAAAAVLVLAVGLGHLARTGGDEIMATTAHFLAGPNELITAVLDDGSVARLAPGTTLEATIGPEGREIHLEGRAFFAVAHDANRPFRVRSREGEVQVLGTRFEVNTQRNQFRILVLDGRVAFLTDGGAAELGAGELVEAAGGTPPIITRVEIPEALLDWMGAWMAFESTPLHRVARELEVRLGIEIEIADDGVADRTVSGWFGMDQQDEMISMICRVADLTCTMEEGRVRIEG